MITLFTELIVNLAGVIMYSDPAEVAPEGTEPSSVYPNTFFLPPSGVQRGWLEDGAE